MKLFGNTTDLFGSSTDKSTDDKPVEEKIEVISSSNTSSVVGVSGGLNFDTAIDCMICGQPFIQDWQHKEYNMCNTCRNKLRALIGR